MASDRTEPIDKVAKWFTYITRSVGLMGVVNYFVLLDLGQDPNPLILTSVVGLAAIGEAVDRVAKSLRERTRE